jgi:hypothetical protein
MCSSRHKDEYPPLLQPGLHEMSMADLKALVVDAFPLSTKRQGHWDNFVKIVDRLKKLKVPCKIWVDGSFLTKKIEPGDVDFVVDLPVQIINNPDKDQGEFFNDLAKRAFKKIEKMHSFVMFDAPVIHADHGVSVRVHEQWKKDFGFSYVKKEPKGIAVVVVKP